MKLIEKKCPNCDANLEFDENAKSCKCSYCNRSFEIERDVNDVDKINLVFEKVEKPVKAIMIIPFVFAFVIILLVTLSIIFGFGHISKTVEDDDFFEDVEETINEKEQLITSADDLTTDNIDDLESHSSTLLHQSVVGRSDTTYSYQRTGDPRLEKTYVASKEDSNYVILIFNVKYHNFFNQSDQQTVYVPSVFENVKKSTMFTGKAKNPAPEYYLNEEKSSYIYAYSSLEEAYNGVVKGYEDQGYTISEK